MFKKKAINMIVASTLLTCGAATTVSANEFYAGLEAGWSDSHIETEIGNISTNGVSATGATYGAIAGYQAQIPDGMLAVELNVGDNTTEYTSKTTQTSEKIEGGVHYGLSAKLGTNILQHGHLYALAGYQWQDMDAQGQQTVGGTQTTEQDDTTFGGPKYGVGLQTRITKELTLRTEWSRTLYDEKTMLGTEIEPTESRFTVGVVGKF